MIHAAKNLRIYHKKKHVHIALGTILIPLVFLVGMITLGGIAGTDLLFSVGITLYRLIISYTISIILGVGIAIFLSYENAAESFIPVLDILQNVPSFALIPIFVLTLGYTNTMAIAFATTSIVWPILFYVLSALRTAKTDLNEAAEIFGARGSKKIFNYLIPLSFPAIVTGSIVGLSIGWEAVIGIEIIGLSNGIGSFLNAAGTSGDKTTLSLGVAAILLVVFVINRLVWVPLIKRTRYYAE
ncbi:MAG: ABC transporter permease subunit [Candidatus Paceibacterota bacterium]|jgi:ABC-type nitrate/sulfonate/bicarbonate transport system permease component